MTSDILTLYIVSRAPPVAAIAMSARAMIPQIRPYSMAVAPLSLARNRLNMNRLFTRLTRSKEVGQMADQWLVGRRHRKVA